MALTSYQQWWVRTDGVDTNGGGFDSTTTSAGTNYSDQASAQVNIDNVTITATSSGSTVTFTAGYTPSAADIGNIYRDTGNGGSTKGYYVITGQTATTWTLSSAIGTSTGLVGKMGGAWLTLQNVCTGGSGSGIFAAPSITSPLAAGHTVNIRGTGSNDPSVSSPDYDWSAGYWTFSAGNSGGTTGGLVKFIGYNGRPGIQTSGTCDYNITYHWWSTVKVWFKTSPTYTTIGFLYTSGNNGAGMTNCILDQNGVDGMLVQTGILINNEFRNSGGGAAGTQPAISVNGYPSFIKGNYIHSIRGYGIQTVSTMSTIINNIIAGCGKAGIYLHATNYGFNVSNNTIDSCTTDGILVDATLPTITSITNNVITNNIGYGLNWNTGTSTITDACNQGKINYNFYYNNKSGGAQYNGISAGANDVTLTGTPYNNAAGGDYSLNNTAGAGASVRAAAFPQSYPGASTNSYPDGGASQHQSAAASSPNIAKIIQNIGTY